MLLVEQTSVQSAALPVAEFKDHVLVGTGFSTDSAQDVVVENYLRAAIAAIEARTGKVLLSKQFTWSLTAWREHGRQALPLAPIENIDEVRVIDRLGQATILAAMKYRLEKDAHRPVLWGADTSLPSIPVGGSAEIDFTAGYGNIWANLPVDLQHAVFLLAAHFYDNRKMVGNDIEMPFGVTSLIERYRNVRLFGGSGK